MATQTMKVGMLLLDVENPRYGQVSSQRDAIGAIINNQGPKLVALAEHLGVNGMNPADSLMVMAKGTSFVVLEGNRRLAAIRLLENPSLASNTPFEKAFLDLAKQFKPPDAVGCVVMPNRDEARPWILLRHGGESGGVGVVPWAAPERERFAPRPGTQVAQGLAFVDAAKAAYPSNHELQQQLDKIRDERISTLGRLIADSEFKKLVGKADKQGKFIARFAAADLQDLVGRMASDFASSMSVSRLKSQAQRAKYLASLNVPAEKVALAHPAPLDATPVGRAANKAAPQSARRAPKSGPLLKDLDLSHFSPRTSEILLELRQLDEVKFPNAASLMLRAVDSTGKDLQYQPIRTGLQDSSSLHSISTLHAYVHSPNYNPTSGDVRSIAANWQPFLQALNDLV